MVVVLRDDLARGRLVPNHLSRQVLMQGEEFATTRVAGSSNPHRSPPGRRGGAHPMTNAGGGARPYRHDSARVPGSEEIPSFLFSGLFVGRDLR